MGTPVLSTQYRVRVRAGDTGSGPTMGTPVSGVARQRGREKGKYPSPYPSRTHNACLKEEGEGRGGVGRRERARGQRGDWKAGVSAMAGHIPVRGWRGSWKAGAGARAGHIPVRG
eukprot:365530-Chlamydomonas_euryale.AAC.32